MKDALQQWLNQRTQLPGVLACGVRFQDRTTLTQTWSDEMSSAALENALRCVSDTFQVLKINFFPDQVIRWVYENALLYCARRDDGVCLGIFTVKDPQAFDPEAVHMLLNEFRGLDGQAAN